jgi:mycobactin lysine-N-oxygenase
VVLGAGAKAVALTAKATVLRELGYPVPEVVVVEPTAVAASWRATGNLTSGDQTLGTPPEKDVGFPYLGSQSWRDGGASDAQLLHRFSWTSYLVHEGGYPGWIDRGRPNPRHDEWARYLGWAARAAGMRTVPGTVTGLDVRDGGWAVRVDLNAGGTTTLSGTGLVVTGYGDVSATEKVPTGTPAANGAAVPRSPAGQLSVPAFWRLAGSGGLPPGGRVMVVGSGEAAAAITEYLLRARRYDVAVVCPWHTLYSRGESVFENEIYSNPARWQKLSPAARREFISRTDRGVFSQKVLDAMTTLGSVEIVGGRVVDVRDGDGELEVVVDAGAEKNSYRADLVVEATGRDAAWFTRLLAPPARTALAEVLGGVLAAPALAEAVAHDLSIANLTPRLHVPNLAGFAQGPGFPGLSCLGLMADRVLASYTALPPAVPVASRVPAQRPRTASRHPDGVDHG